MRVRNSAASSRTSSRKSTRAVGREIEDQLAEPSNTCSTRVSFMPRPRSRIFSDATRYASRSLIGAARGAVDDEIRRWENLSRSTDFTDGAQLATN